MRFTPSAQIHYSPFSWFTQPPHARRRHLVDARLHVLPEEQRNWYAGDQSNGYVEDVQNPINIYTVDYLGNIHAIAGSGGNIASDFSFGSQYINTVNNYLAGIGIGLATNSSNLVSSAATNESHQIVHPGEVVRPARPGATVLRADALPAGRRARRPQLGVRNRIWLAVSAEGERVVRDVAGAVLATHRTAGSRRSDCAPPTVRPGARPIPVRRSARMRRSPTSRRSGGVGPGVVQASPGNPNLKPERGTEFEGGFDAGFFHERAGIELTYFDKQTSDLLLRESARAVARVHDQSVRQRGQGRQSRHRVYSARNTGRAPQRHLGRGAHGQHAAEQARQPRRHHDPRRSRRSVPISRSATSSVSRSRRGTRARSSRSTPSPALRRSRARQCSPARSSRRSRRISATPSRSSGTSASTALITHQQGGKILNVTPLYQDLTGNERRVELCLPARAATARTELIAHEGPFKTPAGTPVPLVLDRYLQPTDFVTARRSSRRRTICRRSSRSGCTRRVRRWSSADATCTLEEGSVRWSRSGAAVEHDDWRPGSVRRRSKSSRCRNPRRWIVRLNLQF